jgi:hypothetical protein
VTPYRGTLRLQNLNPIDLIPVPGIEGQDQDVTIYLCETCSQDGIPFALVRLEVTNIRRRSQ